MCRSDRMIAVFFRMVHVVGKRLHFPRGKGSAGTRQGLRAPA